MKKFTLMLLAAMLSMAVSAQPTGIRKAPALPKSSSTTHVMQQQAARQALAKSLTMFEGQALTQNLASARKASAAGEEVVTPPEGLETQPYRLNTKMQISGWETINRTIQIGFDGDDVYLQGFSYYLPEAWIKGTLNKNHTKVTFPVQYIGQLYNSKEELKDVYFFPATSVDGEWQPYEAVFNYNEELGTFVLQQDVVTYIFENTKTDGLSYFVAYDSEITIASDADTVEVPDDLETEEYQVNANLMDMNDDDEWEVYEPYVGGVKVAIEDDAVYIQGLCSYLPNAWVKGTREGNQFVLESGQFFGTYIYRQQGYPIYLVGYNAETDEAVDIVLTLDEETGVLSTKQWVSLSAIPDDVYAYELYSDFTLKHIPDVAAVPAKPEIQYFEYDEDYEMGLAELSIPTISEDGNPLLTDRLAYQILVDYGDGPEPYVFSAEWHEGLEEDMTVVPYNFSDDIDFLRGGEMILFYEIEPDLQRIGVQSVYTGGDETNYSEIFWHRVAGSDTVELPEGVESSTYLLEAESVFWGDPEEYSADVQVAFDGSDVYIQGLSSWLPNAWVKGTLSEDGTTVTFPQAYLGNMLAYGQFDMTFTFNGAEFEYDAEAGTLTSAEGYTTTSAYELDGEEMEEDADVMINVVITKANDVAATPAAPVIENFYDNELNLYIPLEDVDGNPIFASKLSYQIFSKKNGEATPLVLWADDYEFAEEDMSIIPYLYTDYWEVTKGGETVFIYEPDVDEWEAIGVKSIYTAGGETRESTITWKENDWATDGIHNMGTDSNGETQTTVYYDLQGRRVDAHAKGMIIKQVRQADGRVATRKEVQK